VECEHNESKVKKSPKWTADGNRSYKEQIFGLLGNPLLLNIGGNTAQAKMRSRQPFCGDIYNANMEVTYLPYFQSLSRRIEDCCFKADLYEMQQQMRKFLLDLSKSDPNLINLRTALNKHFHRTENAKQPLNVGSNVGKFPVEAIGLFKQMFDAYHNEMWENWKEQQAKPKHDKNKKTPFDMYCDLSERKYGIRFSHVRTMNFSENVLSSDFHGGWEDSTHGYWSNFKRLKNGCIVPNDRNWMGKVSQEDIESFNKATQMQQSKSKEWVQILHERDNIQESKVMDNSMENMYRIVVANRQNTRMLANTNPVSNVVSMAPAVLFVNTNQTGNASKQHGTGVNNDIAIETQAPKSASKQTQQSSNQDTAVASSAPLQAQKQQQEHKQQQQQDTEMVKPPQPAQKDRVFQSSQPDVDMEQKQQQQDTTMVTPPQSAQEQPSSGVSNEVPYETPEQSASISPEKMTPEMRVSKHISDNESNASSHSRTRTPTASPGATREKSIPKSDTEDSLLKGNHNSNRTFRKQLDQPSKSAESVFSSDSEATTARPPSFGRRMLEQLCAPPKNTKPQPQFTFTVLPKYSKVFNPVNKNPTTLIYKIPESEFGRTNYDIRERFNICDPVPGFPRYVNETIFKMSYRVCGGS
jgi:hypothetical protein